MARPNRPPRIVTLCCHGRTALPKDNAERIALVPQITRLLYERPDWHPIDAVVFPGGFFRMSRPFGPSSFAQRRSAVSSEQFAKAIRVMVGILDGLSPGVRVVTGVLATPRDLTERTEQSSLAFSASTLVSVSRKIFPTAQDTRGKRYITPFVADYSSAHRFLDLANGSVALLSACYDLFGVGDIATDTAARRLAIRRLYLGRRPITHGEEAFIEARHNCLAAWTELVHEKRPDVALATIHGFRQAGQDGYWQRHGIARASAALGGALVAAGAHFQNGLPYPTSSTLASWNVPRVHLARGLTRKAHRLEPTVYLVSETTGPKILLRLFTRPRTSDTGGQ